MASLKRDGVALAAYLEDREGWAFGYDRSPKVHDCARFVNGGVLSARGVAPLSRFASQWTSLRGARRVLTAHGGMAAAVSEVMTPLASVTMAKRGDVGLTDDNTLVLVEGDMVVGLHPKRGQVRVPRAMLIMAWTV